MSPVDEALAVQQFGEQVPLARCPKLTRTLLVAVGAAEAELTVAVTVVLPALSGHIFVVSVNVWETKIKNFQLSVISRIVFSYMATFSNSTSQMDKLCHRSKRCENIFKILTKPKHKHCIGKCMRELSEGNY